MLTAVPNTRLEMDKMEEKWLAGSKLGSSHKLQASLIPTRVELLTPSNAHHTRQLKRDLPYDSLNLKFQAAPSAAPLSDQLGKLSKEQPTATLCQAPPQSKKHKTQPSQH